MSNEKILVVDDEPAIIQLCTRLLTREGYAVKAVSNGMDALRILNEEPVDLLMTDIRMQGMNGFELIDAVKKHNRRIPIIVITGHSTMNTVTESLKLGIQGFVIKPFKISELLTAVRQAMDSPKTSEGPSL
jgi:DNA-binding NtrC family response regulator